MTDLLTNEEAAALAKLPPSDFGWFGEEAIEQFDKIASESGVKDTESFRAKVNFELRKVWVNQPSTLQPHHEHHGLRGYCEDTGEQMVRVWLISGNTVFSTTVDRMALATWRVG